MVKKQSINHLSLKPQRKARKPRVPDAHTYSSEARIAKWFRYCRNYAHETQKRPGMDAGARRTAPWTARFDGFVKHRNPSSIISYSILPTKRSTRDSTCATAVPAAAPRTTSINIDIQNLLKQILHTVHTDKNCRSIVQKCCRSRRKHTCHTKSNKP